MCGMNDDFVKVHQVGTYSYWPFNFHQRYLREHNISFRDGMYLHIRTIYLPKVVIEANLG